MLGSSGGPGGPRELLAQTGIANARNGEAQVTDRLKQGAVFAAQVQGADPTALVGAAVDVGVQQVAQRRHVAEGGQLGHQPLVDLLGDLGAQRNVSDTFTQRSQLLGGRGRLALGAPIDMEHFGRVDRSLNAQDVLFVVDFDAVMVDPVTDSHAIVEVQHPGHDLVSAVGIRLASGRQRPVEIAEHTDAVACCRSLREAWAKRRYEAHFVSKLTDADGENAETDTSLDMAHDCSYLTDAEHAELTAECAEIGRMLGAMIQSPEKFLTSDF